MYVKNPETGMYWKSVNDAVRYTCNNHKDDCGSCPLYDKYCHAIDMGSYNEEIVRMMGCEFMPRICEILDMDTMQEFSINGYWYIINRDGLIDSMAPSRQRLDDIIGAINGKFEIIRKPNKDRDVDVMR